MTATILASVVLCGLLLWIAMTRPPAAIATFLRMSVPIALIAAGGILTLASRGGIGLPLVVFGVTLYRRWRRRMPLPSSAARAPNGKQSLVRSRFLEMILDHDTGHLSGRVIGGRQAERSLDGLDETALLSLREELAVDPESLKLLETYLDRRIPRWRDDLQAKAGGGLGGSPGTGPMTEQEAYQILGLEPGAPVADIREAHRRLMKRVHPDQGGTDFLAARINEAKALLIDRHH